MHIHKWSKWIDATVHSPYGYDYDAQKKICERCNKVKARKVWR